MRGAVGYVSELLEPVIEFDEAPSSAVSDFFAHNVSYEEGRSLHPVRGRYNHEGDPTFRAHKRGDYTRSQMKTTYWAADYKFNEHGDATCKGYVQKERSMEIPVRASDTRVGIGTVRTPSRFSEADEGPEFIPCSELAHDWATKVCNDDIEL